MFLIGVLRNFWLWISRSSTQAPERPSEVPVSLPDSLLPLMGCASVIIPEVKCTDSIGETVRLAMADPCTAEVIVVVADLTADSAQIARTEGAEVVAASMSGLAAAMREAAGVARCPWLVFLVDGPQWMPLDIVAKLCRPLIRGHADLVKGLLTGPSDSAQACRVHSTLARYFPELQTFERPLAGPVAISNTLVDVLSGEDGPGAPAAVLIDAQQSGARIQQVSVEAENHDESPEHVTAEAALDAMRIVLSRARRNGRLYGEQLAEMYDAQHEATTSFETASQRILGRKCIVLLDMNGVLTPSDFEFDLALGTGRTAALRSRLGGTGDEPSRTRCAAVASALRGVPLEQFVKVARETPLRTGLLAWLRQLRRAGFAIGVVHDGCFVAAEILRRRVFADFALAHTLLFDGDDCTGELRLNTAFAATGATGAKSLCLSNVVRHFRTSPASPPIETIWAVAHERRAENFLLAADRGIVVASGEAGWPDGTALKGVRSFEELRFEPLVPMGSGSRARR